MDIIKLFSTSVTDSNAVTSTTIPRRGIIRAIMAFMNCWPVGAAAGYLRYELSFSNQSQLTQTDIINTAISEISVGWVSVAANSNSNMAEHLLTAGLNYRVEQGTRLYVNVDQQGTVSSGCFGGFYIYID